MTDKELQIIGECIGNGEPVIFKGTSVIDKENLINQLTKKLSLTKQQFQLIWLFAHPMH